MTSNNIRISQLISFLTSCFALPLFVIANEDYQLIDTHHVATASNKADVDLVFDQTGIHEGFRLELYNSNPDSPVLVIMLNEIEQLHAPPSQYSRAKSPTLKVSVKKSIFFHPAVLSGTEASSLEFDYRNPRSYDRMQEVDESYEQTRILYRVSTVWSSQSLILTFYQNWETPKKIDVTEWVRKRGIKIVYTPQISRIDALAKHSNSSVVIESDYLLTESLGLNFPLWQQMFGETKKTLETPDVFWLPTDRDIEDVIIKMCEKICSKNTSLIYLLSPFIDSFTSKEGQQIAQLIPWKTTSSNQDAIYNDVIKLAGHRFYSKERVIWIDEASDEIIWPKIRKIIDRSIYLYPENSVLNKYWVISSRMTWDLKISNSVCEYTEDGKNCQLFSAMPVNLENRLVFLTRDQARNVKAWLGAQDFEQINLTENFPDLRQVEEFEFSEEFKEWYLSLHPE